MGLYEDHPTKENPMKPPTIEELEDRKQYFIDRLVDLLEALADGMPPAERRDEIRQEIAKCFYGVELINRHIAILILNEGI